MHRSDVLLVLVLLFPLVERPRQHRLVPQLPPARSSHQDHPPPTSSLPTSAQPALVTGFRWLKRRGLTCPLRVAVWGKPPLLWWHDPPGMSRGRGREHTRNAPRGNGVRRPFGAHARWGLGPPPRLTSSSRRGRVGQGLTRTRGHAAPRSGPPRGAWKLVVAPLTGAKPGAEIRSRPLSISYEDFDRRLESLGISP